MTSPTPEGQRVAGNIVGWVVFTKTPETGAMFSLAEQSKAFSTAKRWGASIRALVLHPDLPTTSGREGERG